MATRTIAKVKVTQECIELGTPKEAESCPIYWAIFPMLREDVRKMQVDGCNSLDSHKIDYDAEVDVYLDQGDYTEHFQFDLPIEATKFIMAFDEDPEIKILTNCIDKPFEFILDSEDLEEVIKPEYLETKRY